MVKDNYPTDLHIGYLLEKWSNVRRVSVLCNILEYRICKKRIKNSGWQNSYKSQVSPCCILMEQSLLIVRYLKHYSLKIQVVSQRDLIKISSLWNAYTSVFLPAENWSSMHMVMTFELWSHGLLFTSYQELIIMEHRCLLQKLILSSVNKSWIG